MLTVAEIESYKHSGKKTPDKKADGGGLYVFISKKSKVWKYLYRYNGTQNTLTLGTYPKMLPKEARIELSKAKELLASGIDPNQAKKDKIAYEKEQTQLKRQQEAFDSNTFEVVAKQWFNINTSGWSESHAKKLIGRLENHAFPAIGRMPISSIRKADTIHLIESIVKAGKNETASRIYQIIKSIFIFANDRDLIENIPMTSKKSLIPVFESKHMPAITDEKRLGEFLRAVEGYSGSLITRCALKLVCYLPIRQGEFRTANWDEFDLEKAVWTIPAKHRKLAKIEKNNPTNYLIMPLSHQAVEILKELKKFTGDGSFVFPNQQVRNNGCMSENTVNKAISSLGFKGEMTAHGLRSTFSTLMNEEGFDADKIDMQLGHKKKDKVESRYNRAEFILQRQAMMQHYANFIDTLRQGAQVVSINKTAV